MDAGKMLALQKTRRDSSAAGGRIGRKRRPRRRPRNDNVGCKGAKSMKSKSLASATPACATPLTARIRALQTRRQGPGGALGMTAGENTRRDSSGRPLSRSESRKLSLGPTLRMTAGGNVRNETKHGALKHRRRIESRYEPSGET